MPSSKTLFLHIGWPKTGTTTLQNHLFSKHSDIINLNHEKLDDILNWLFYARENAFERNKNKLQERLLAIFKAEERRTNSPSLAC